jgi:hypothetical protein
MQSDLPRSRAFSYDPAQKQKEGKRGRSEVDINLEELELKTCQVISGTKSIEIEGRKRNSETKIILSFSRDIRCDDMVTRGRDYDTE